MSNRDQTHYEELDLCEDATPAQIQAAFRALARKHHPDRNRGTKEAEERFKKINAAYVILGDVDARAAYDTELARLRDALTPSAQAFADASKGPPLRGDWASMGFWLPIVVPLLFCLVSAYCALVAGLGLIVWTVYRRSRGRRTLFAIMGRRREKRWMSVAAVCVGLLLVLRWNVGIRWDRAAAVEAAERAHERAMADAHEALRISAWRDRLTQARQAAETQNIQLALALTSALASELEAETARVYTPDKLLTLILDVQEFRRELQKKQAAAFRNVVLNGAAADDAKRSDAGIGHVDPDLLDPQSVAATTSAVPVQNQCAAMDRNKVASSEIKSIGYCPPGRVLEVEFVRGSVYRYFDVPERVFNDLMMASSHGRFFNSVIRGRGYHYQRVR